MGRIFVPSKGPSDWQKLLAHPQRHWRPGKSAFESAVAWEAARSTARGLPAEVARTLDSHARTEGGELLVAVPELRVDLPGGGHPSQNDVWALVRAKDALCSLAIEAKSGESLGELVGEWLPKPDDTPPSGKPSRLEFLRGCLSLGQVDINELRYQLLHRAASAILMGERFRAMTAVLLVHSFGGTADDKSRDDYRRFAETMLCVPSFDSLALVGRSTRLPLLLGWMSDRPASAGVVARLLKPTWRPGDAGDPEPIRAALKLKLHEASLRIIAGVPGAVDLGDVERLSGRDWGDVLAEEAQVPRDIVRLLTGR